MLMFMFFIGIPYFILCAFYVFYIHSYIYNFIFYSNLTMSSKINGCNSILLLKVINNSTYYTKSNLFKVYFFLFLF